MTPMPLAAVERDRIPALESLLDRLAALPDDWHGAGVLDMAALSALGRHAARIQPACSLETGSGKTTLLLSHLSARHLVFSVDGGGSLTRARTSPLLRQTTVEFIEGPTQRTLLGYEFTEPLQLAFLDGPHAFPYPDLEYWRVYPQLAPGGLLVVDDIQIPTIRLLFNVLREDPMFRLLEVVSKTAFFERTDAPTFDPFADGWWEQPFNTRRLDLVDQLETVHGSLWDADLAGRYRDRLVPLVGAWRDAGTRVAVFGIGPHTALLHRVVPELDGLLVAYLDSQAVDGQVFRGIHVRRPDWAAGNVDVVLCSSFAHEWRQMELLDGVAVKAVLSHDPSSR